MHAFIIIVLTIIALLIALLCNVLYCHSKYITQSLDDIADAIITRNKLYDKELYAKYNVRLVAMEDAIEEADDIFQDKVQFNRAQEEKQKRLEKQSKK
jgi:glycerol-3-phosphate cytidylyltransferase-like family protein